MVGSPQRPACGLVAGKGFIMPRKVYFIMETLTDNNGNYIPCIAVENVRGFYRTDWEWGNDLDIAQQIVDDRNEKLGLSKKEAMIIQLSSMRE